MLIWNICQCSTFWKRIFYVSLVRLGAARKKSKTKKGQKNAFYFCLFVCFSAFVVCIFSDEDQGRSTFQEKSYLFTCHECKTNIIYKYIYIWKKNTVLLYHVLKWHQKEASTTSTWFFTWWSEMPNKLRVPNSSASRYEYSLNIINHCHLSECKWKHSVTFVTRCTVGGNDSANTIDFLLALFIFFFLSPCTLH